MGASRGLPKPQTGRLLFGGGGGGGGRDALEWVGKFQGRKIMGNCDKLRKIAENCRKLRKIADLAPPPPPPAPLPRPSSTAGHPRVRASFKGFQGRWVGRSSPPLPPRSRAELFRGAKENGWSTLTGAAEGTREIWRNHLGAGQGGEWCGTPPPPPTHTDPSGAESLDRAVARTPSRHPQARGPGGGGGAETKTLCIKNGLTPFFLR